MPGLPGEASRAGSPSNKRSRLLLNGANPGDIPFYQPTKFQLLVNLKAAKEFGPTVSEPLLARADEVIE